MQETNISTYKFVKDLINQQISFIINSDEKSAGYIAKGLFNNQDFCNVVLNLFDYKYLQETENEIVSEGKQSVLFTLEKILFEINKKL